LIHADRLWRHEIDENVIAYPDDHPMRDVLIAEFVDTAIGQDAEGFFD
jgi:hypothetical protein